MTKKTLITSVILLMSLSFTFIISTVYFENVKQKDIYKVRTFECNKGWGYEIIEKEKTIIHQSYIPCIEGNKPFPDEKSALETGKLVILKLKNQENPSITIEELNTILDINNKL
jgi:hypothetical protein